MKVGEVADLICTLVFNNATVDDGSEKSGYTQSL